MVMDSKMYDVLKFIALRVLPALATLVIVLGEIWHWDWANYVGATITAVDTFLGTVLGVSSKNYWALDENVRNVYDEEPVENEGE